MKKILSSLFALMIGFSATAQLDRSVRPAPAEAKPLEFGEYDVFELDNGINIIVVENDKLPRVAISLLVDIMPLAEGDKAGYIGLTGELLRQGTVNRPKDQLDEEVDFIGASLYTGSSSVYASGLSKYTEKLVDIVADVALNPAFPEEEFEKLRKQSLSGIESAKESPDALSSRLWNATVYGANHPYGELETESSINNITVEDCKNYYQNYWAPNKTYIAVVGDVKAKKVKKLIDKKFGDWATKEVPTQTYPDPALPEGVVVNMINRNSAVQTVLELGNTIELEPGDPNIVKVRLMNQILGGGSLGRLFKNIREDKGYTYGAYSSYDSDRLVGVISAGASVRNEVTDSAVNEFIYEFERLQNELVSEDDLQNAKNYINGSFGRSLESPQTLASFALNIERYNLPKDYYETYLQRLNALTAEDIKAAANEYLKTENLTITAVGKAAEIAPALEKFGPISYYDFNGEETGPPSMPVPEGVTAETVINNYIEAIGGAEALAKVKDIRMAMDVEIAGMPMKATSVMLRKRPNLMVQEMSVEGMGTVQKLMFNGEKAVSSGMQGTKELEGEELEAIKDQGAFFPEQDYVANGYELALSGIVMTEGIKAYAMEVTDPNGDKFTEYYAVESGLKVREESTEETEEGPMTSAQVFSDYQKVGNIMLPYKTVILQGAQTITMSATEAEVNSGLKKSDFE